MACNKRKIKENRIKKFLCRIGWHKPIYYGFDGASFQAKCKWCGYEGLIDSQGNLF